MGAECLDEDEITKQTHAQRDKERQWQASGFFHIASRVE
jgi:hypothetical protein